MALTDKLTAIGDAIRTKTGKTATMTLDQMVTEIEGIETGASAVTITLTGDLSNFNNAGRADELFNNESVNIEFANISNMDNMHQNATGLVDAKTVGYNKYMFDGCTNLKTVTGVSGATETENNSIQYMFRNCTNLETVDITGTQKLADGTNDYAFYGCNNLTSIANASVNFDGQTVTSVSMSHTFENCYKLKSIPNGFLSGLATSGQNDTAIYLNGSRNNIKKGTTYADTFKNCLSLRSLQVYRQGRDATYSVSNTSLFSGAFDNLAMLSSIKFCSSTLATGGYYDYNHGYTIDLSTCGYLADESYVDIMTEMYGSPVTTQEEYEAKKDTEDWWTTDPAFSRFDLNSFKEAIQYLPRHGKDSSNKSTTSYIKFKEDAGSNTTNGGISSTAANINSLLSYATSNGWTVAYV